jgi:hypothetical protein
MLILCGPGPGTGGQNSGIVGHHPGPGFTSPLEGRGPAVQPEIGEGSRQPIGGQRGDVPPVAEEVQWDHHRPGTPPSHPRCHEAEGAENVRS